MKLHGLYPTLLLSVLALAGCNVNQDIVVPANAKWSSGSSTVNGEITVGAGAVVDGGLRTVNGGIQLGAGARTGDLTSVNGPIELAADAQASEIRGVNADITLGKQTVADGTVETVNGDIGAASGSRIHGDARDVNGGIALCGSQVSGNLVFYNGTVQLAGNSVVQGDIIAKKPQDNDNQGNRTPYLIVGPGSSVGGTITFERPGELYVSDSAVIHGVTGVAPVKFSGPAPAGVQLPQCPAS